MWAHDIDSAEYAARLDGIEAALPGHDGGRRAGVPTTRPRSEAARSTPARRPRHRDVVRRDGGRGRRSAAPTCCRRSCRARSTCTPASAASCPRSPAGPTSSCSRRWSPEALVEAGVERRRASTRWPPRSGPGLVGALLVGVSAAKALALVWDVPFVAREPPRGAPLRGVPRGARPRAAARRAAGVGRPHDARADGGPRRSTGCSARPSTTPPARRSTRSPATSASATRAARPSTGSAHRGRPDGDRASRGRCSTTGSTSRSAGSRRRSSTTCASTPTVATADVAASFQEAVVDVLVAKARRGRPRSAPRACALGGGVAANSLLRERLLDACDGRRAARRSCPAGRCAPTTRHDRGRRLVAARSDGPSPLDTGADPNLRLALLID